MPPTIHCVRHAQGIHNLSVANHAIRDPILTDLGHEQCRKLREKFPFHSEVDMIVSSPLRRTVYTALHGFGPVFETHEGLTVIAHPDIQETSALPCDTGSDPQILREEFERNGYPVDLSMLHDGWNIKQGRYAPTSEAIKERARSARRWLKARPEKEIIVVTHGGFLHYCTEDWEDSSEYAGTGWANTEYRTFKFADVDHQDDLEGYELDAGNATLVETAESRRRRGKITPAPPRHHQKDLYRLGVQEWDSKGLGHNTMDKEGSEVPEGQEIEGRRV